MYIQMYFWRKKRKDTRRNDRVWCPAGVPNPRSGYRCRSVGQLVPGHSGTQWNKVLLLITNLLITPKESSHITLRFSLKDNLEKFQNKRSKQRIYSTSYFWSRVTTDTSRPFLGDPWCIWHKTIMKSMSLLLRRFHFIDWAGTHHWLFFILPFVLNTVEYMWREQSEVG